MVSGVRELGRKLLPTALVCGAFSVTVGWVVEDPGGSVETEAVGVLREVEPSRNARVLASALARSPVIAQELRRSRTFLERPATLLQAVSVRVDFPLVTVGARHANGEYAALLANHWMDAVNTVFRRLVTGVAAERRELIAGLEAKDPGGSREPTALPLLRRERARSVVRGVPGSMADSSPSAAHLVQFGIGRIEPAELVATVSEAVPPGPPPAPSFTLFLLWLAAGIGFGAGAGGLWACVRKRVQREAGL
jgi:hypothetical protein